MLCEFDEHGHVLLTPADRSDAPNVGDLRANVERYCRRIGMTEPWQVEAVYARWKAREDAGGGRPDQQQ